MHGALVEWPSSLLTLGAWRWGSHGGREGERIYIIGRVHPSV